MSLESRVSKLESNLGTVKIPEKFNKPIWIFPQDKSLHNEFEAWLKANPEVEKVFQLIVIRPPKKTSVNCDSLLDNIN